MKKAARISFQLIEQLLFFMGDTVRQLILGVTQLRDRLKAVGGKWNFEEKVWHVPYGLIRGTELEKRIVGEGR